MKEEKHSSNPENLVRGLSVLLVQLLLQLYTGFILNLENRPFYKKSGKTWNSQGTFYNFYLSQGKQSI